MRKRNDFAKQEVMSLMIFRVNKMASAGADLLLLLSVA